MTLSHFLETVYVPLRLRGRSENSVRLLRHAVRQFSRFLRREAMLADLDDLVVSQYLAARGRTLSPYSVERERCGILALWRLAADRRLVDVRPCVQAELLPERTPRAFTGAELRSLFLAAGAEPGFVGPVPAGTFWLALVAALFESGERVSAMLAAPKAGWSAPFLRIPAAIRKGRRRERVYELSADTAALVDAASRHDAPTLFFWPLDRATVYNRFGRITERAGLGRGRDVKFHALRRSTASHLAASGLGIDVAGYMGHGSDRVTRRSYLDPRIVQAGGPKPLDALARIFRAG
jgi:site-specific recombinase XerD